MLLLLPLFIYSFFLLLAVSGLFVAAAVAVCLWVLIYVSCALFKFELFVRVVLGTDFCFVNRFCYAFYLIQSCRVA